MSLSLLAIGAVSALAGFAGVTSAYALVKSRSTLNTALRVLERSKDAQESLIRVYTKMVLNGAYERRHAARVQELLEANNKYLDRARKAEFHIRLYQNDLTHLGTVNKAHEATLDYIVNALDIKREDILEDDQVPDQVKATLISTLERTGTWAAEPASVQVAA
jgi:hypothetical protein